MKQRAPGQARRAMPVAPALGLMSKPLLLPALPELSDEIAEAVTHSTADPQCARGS
jgi:hypothetical protein